MSSATSYSNWSHNVIRTPWYKYRWIALINRCLPDSKLPFVVFAHTVYQVTTYNSKIITLNFTRNKRSMLFTASNGSDRNIKSAKSWKWEVLLLIWVINSTKPKLSCDIWAPGKDLRVPLSIYSHLIIFNQAFIPVAKTCLDLLLFWK